ncbi:hypothetical protein FRAAL6478 [Frankia alni ACN14a]|uniref:Uncharacterized protein n=1 Tax=Frankia alni (strain DSM 45986 / CECT 9034 / ACN14a) TaxID=326424 RepID=Q0RBT3_FRAAA|nr:hypothetical protein FRAAL6478 [Frankia alni ACN14a]
MRTRHPSASGDIAAPAGRAFAGPEVRRLLTGVDVPLAGTGRRPLMDGTLPRWPPRSAVIPNCPEPGRIMGSGTCGEDTSAAHRPGSIRIQPTHQSGCGGRQGSVVRPPSTMNVIPVR